MENCPKNIVQEGDKKYFYDKDGMKFEWDEKQRAWFPLIDDKFIERYNYTYNGAEIETNETAERSKDNALSFLQHGNDEINKEIERINEDYDIKNLEFNKKNQLQQHESENEVNQESSKKEIADVVQNKRPKGWNPDMEANKCAVYVKNLPLDLTVEQFEEMMSKYGIIAKDPITFKLKLKLYTDKETGHLKGDGVCTYIKPESVTLAMKLLNESKYESRTILCEPAHFELKGDFDPKKGRKRNLTKTQKKKLIEGRNKLFKWQPESKSDRKSHESTVVLKNCFAVEDFDNDLYFKSKLKKLIQSICSKFGEIARITIYDQNLEGVITVRFANINEADMCIAGCNKTLLINRIITAESWNGREKFYIIESEDAEQKRLDEWHNFIE